MNDDVVSCKCCGSTSSFVGTLDFNKSCVDHIIAKPFPPANQPVAYYSCGACAFVFSVAMDNWSDEDFKSKIYNDDYERVDPPIPGRINVPVKEMPGYQKGKYIASFFPGTQKDISILDYGSAGNPGSTGLALLEEGFNITSYDPFRGNISENPKGNFDLILAIEVFEHVSDLKKLGLFMKEHLSRDGLIWIQTLLHPHPSPPNVLESWYIAPRNGHISIFSLHALTLLFRPFGINIAQTSAGIFGFKNLPMFPNRVFVRN